MAATNKMRLRTIGDHFAELGQFMADLIRDMLNDDPGIVPLD